MQFKIGGSYKTVGGWKATVLFRTAYSFSLWCVHFAPDGYNNGTTDETICVHDQVGRLQVEHHWNSNNFCNKRSLSFNSMNPADLTEVEL